MGSYQFFVFLAVLIQAAPDNKQNKRNRENLTRSEKIQDVVNITNIYLMQGCLIFAKDIKQPPLI